MNVYYEGKHVSGAHSESFRQLVDQEGQPTSYFKDQEGVYAFGKRLKGLSAGLKVLSEFYLIDQEKAYYQDHEISGALVNSFALLPGDGMFAKDQTRVYYRGQPVSGVLPGSVQVLERGYLKDESRVFHLTGSDCSEVIGADAKSFRVTGWDEKSKSEATDGSRFYLEGKLVGK